MAEGGALRFRPRCSTGTNKQGDTNKKRGLSSFNSQPPILIIMVSFKLSSMALLLALLTGIAQATTITVDAGGLCTLADATTSSNTDAATGGCAIGSGADTIILEKDVTLAATLPEITSTVTLEGGGHFISGNGLVLVLKIANSGNLTLNNTTIKDGKGGIDNSGAIILNNSTISGNSGGSCEAGISNHGTATLNNSTISGNGTAGLCMSAGYEGLGSSSIGGIFNSGTITLKNSIVSGNLGHEIASDNGIITADSWNVFGHNNESNENAFYGFTPGGKDVTATSDGTKPTALANIFSPLAANGGATLTYALVAGSPAIDVDMTCSTNLTTDQRGYVRPVGSGCDAGAVEYNPSSTDSDSDGIADVSDNCPLIANPDQSDTDKDNIGDACDDDVDGDGVVNGQDNCPIVSNLDQQDKDKDGIGDTCDPHDDRVNMSPIYKLLLLN